MLCFRLSHVFLAGARPKQGEPCPSLRKLSGGDPCIALHLEYAGHMASFRSSVFCASSARACEYPTTASPTAISSGREPLRALSKAALGGAYLDTARANFRLDRPAVERD